MFISMSTYYMGYVLKEAFGAFVKILMDSSPSFPVPLLSAAIQKTIWGSHSNEKREGRTRGFVEVRWGEGLRVNKTSLILGSSLS